MNCQECQRVLLALDDPATQPMEAAAHLAECGACQQWHRRLLQIESNVPLLPVPASRGAEKTKRLIMELPHAAASAKPAPATPATDRPASPRIAPQTVPAQPATAPRWSRLRIAVTAISAVAAAILLTFLGVQLGNLVSRSLQNGPNVAKNKPEEQPAPPKKEDKKQPAVKSLAAAVLELDVQLAQTSDPKERVEALAALADVLHRETKALSQSGGKGSKELQVLARLYGRVLKDGVVARAQDVPMAERRAVLDPIAQKLVQARKQSVQMAAEVEPALSAPFMQIAAVAEKSNGQLRKLMEEATP
jgi:hypothetical protein